MTSEFKHRASHGEVVNAMLWGLTSSEVELSAGVLWDVTSISIAFLDSSIENQKGRYIKLS